MRKLTILLLVIISLLEVKNSYSQFANWSPLKRITYGYKDSNPDFSSVHKYSYMNFSEFMVFQRKIDTASQICVIRFYNTGPSDSVRYITSNNYFKRNPCVAARQLSSDTIRYAFALWESNQNGKWDIYGSYYTYPSGWSPPFPVDSGAGNKFNPKVTQISVSDFGIVYTKDDDIIYRRYNAQTRTIVNETNISFSISGACGNCLIANEGSESLRLNFRSKKTDNNYCIYRALSNNYGTTWYVTDTITNIGNNFPVQLAEGIGTQQIFESNRNGKIGIYSIPIFGSPPQPYVAINSPYFNYYGMKIWQFPILTDAIGASVGAVVRKSNDSTKIMFSLGTSTTMFDSVSAGDTSKNISIALNAGMRSGDLISFFVVFNLDTAGYTSLYYKQKLVSLTGIIKTENTIAGNFYLHQNYPNPFNPTTKIKFDIPKLSDVKIIIFDAVGREVKNITQNNLTVGSYEYEFSGENLSSGIYYFKLQTNEFSKSVKMVLVK